MKLSVVIPVYNEEGNIGPLLEAVARVCKDVSHEVLVINDGSTDGSRKEIESALPRHPALSLINLKRNFGQTAAMAAGIDHAQGEFIIPLDGDGQNDPDDIPLLLALAEQGYDVVSGWRKNRHDSLISRRIPSYLANAMISFVTGVPLHDYGCTMKVYRRTIIGNLQIAGEMHRFLPAWCVWQGGRVVEIEVRHRPRTRGESKYGFLRIFKVLADLATLKFFSGYLFKPNYLFSGSGLALMVLAGATLVLSLWNKALWGLLFAAFLGALGFFLVLMGLLAEILVRLYFEVRHQRPYRLENE